MAALQREGEGGLDRSLQQMLRAIVEERSRLALRHQVSGLGESVPAALLGRKAVLVSGAYSRARVGRIVALQPTPQQVYSGVGPCIFHRAYTQASNSSLTAHCTAGLLRSKPHSFQ